MGLVGSGENISDIRNTEATADCSVKRWRWIRFPPWRVVSNFPPVRKWDKKKTRTAWRLRIHDSEYERWLFHWWWRMTCYNRWLRSNQTRVWAPSSLSRECLRLSEISEILRNEISRPWASLIGLKFHINSMITVTGVEPRASSFKLQVTPKYQNSSGVISS